jgi:hypothetical protein
MTELCEIMKRCGSDKSTSHNYAQIYYLIFSDLRNKNINLFEMGIGTNNPDLVSSMGIDGRPGASLRAWSEFFPNASIYSGDIDRDILFSEDRIKTTYCNQLLPNTIYEMWKEFDVEFDIMIDDGLHTFEANCCLLENSIHRLKEGGYYIIEDILNYNIDKFNTMRSYYLNRFDLKRFDLIELCHPDGRIDNNIIIIKK